MKFSIAAVACLVGNGLALTQEEQAAANSRGIGIQETAQNINSAQAAQDPQKGYGGGNKGYGGGDEGYGGGDGGYGDNKGYGGGDKKGYGGVDNKGYGGGEKKGYGSGDNKGYGGGEKKGYGSGDNKGYRGVDNKGYGGGDNKGYGGGEKKGYGGVDNKGYGGGEKKGYGGGDEGYGGGDKGYGGGDEGDEGHDEGHEDHDEGHEGHGEDEGYGGLGGGDEGYGGGLGGGYGEKKGCKHDVRRVRDSVKALLKQVEEIRCESCHKPKPTTHYPKPTHYPEPEPYPTSTKKHHKACATPTCGKPGVKFNRYKNPFRRDFSSSYKTFDLKYFLKQKPVESGIVTDISLVSGANNKTYASAAMEYRTFLFACHTGKYKFHSPKSDDITLMWFGDENVKDSTRENADIFQAWYGDNKPKTVYKEIKAGVYYPIRILWGNTNGAGYLKLDITSPKGNKLTGADKEGSYVVTENCESSNPYGDKAKTADEYDDDKSYKTTSAYKSKPTESY